MVRLGNPARDIIIAGDERYYDAMERGSRALRYAIEDYWIGRAHQWPARALNDNGRLIG